MPHIKFNRRSSSPSERHRAQSRDIPNQVLHHAFRYFSDPTQEIRNASKDWTSLDEYPFMWTNLVFRGSKTSTNTICDILQNGSPFHGRLFYEELVHLRDLRSLRMGCSSLLCSRDIQAVAAACRGRLSHFCLMQCPDGPPRAVSVYAPTPPSPAASRHEVRLGRVSLREPPPPITMGPLPLTSADCALVLRMLGPTLRVLELDVAGVDLWALQGLVLHCPILRCLCLLNAKNISGDLVRQLPSTAPRLVHLVVRHAPLLGDEHFTGFLERGGQSEKGSKESESNPEDDEGAAGGREEPLEKEWWEWGFWSDHEDDSDEEDDALDSTAQKQEAGSTEVIPPKKTLPTGLVTLDVGMCPFITDRLLLAISSSPAAGELRRLNLRGCQLVTDKGLSALLNVCTALRHLDVSFVCGGHGPGPEWMASVCDGGFPELITLIIGWQNDRDPGGRRKDSLEKLGVDRQGLTVKRRLSRFSSRVVTIS
ncbi:uncharacterized protein LOC124156174 isoform X2 [Ischnura elegans]|uniref:uncharacterized protein LOC124156174 isoform X2 n=1 Tax=Ischnura elegans TaxID=197161 RepID=UPI001ED8A919|nr:uncharacterized protein LOC124156174 isoform X2 [Ischnura elegans]